MDRGITSQPYWTPGSRGLASAALGATSQPARASASAGSSPPAAAPVARAPAAGAARPLASLDLGPALGHLRRPRLGARIPTVTVLLEAPGAWAARVRPRRGAEGAHQVLVRGRVRVRVGLGLGLALALGMGLGLGIGLRIGLGLGLGPDRSRQAGRTSSPPRSRPPP